MEIFVAPEGQPVVFPASLTTLEEAYPGTMFTPLMTAEQKAQFGLFQVSIQEQPPHDPRTEILTQNPPEQIDGRWVIGWSVRAATPGEIPREPQWSEWGESLLLPDIRAVSLQINQNAPDIASSLTFGVLNAENDQGAKFLRVWKIALATMPSIAPIVPRMQELARAHELPEAFVNALAPSP